MNANEKNVAASSNDNGAVEAASLKKIQSKLSSLTEAFVKEAKGIADVEGVDLEVIVRFGVSPKKQQGE